MGGGFFGGVMTEWDARFVTYDRIAGLLAQGWHVEKRRCGHHSYYAVIMWRPA